MKREGSMSVLRPLPTGKEIKLDSKRFIVSKTDTTGKILYGNNYFTEISGYREEELIGRSHSIVRHPDMPKAIFYLMWAYLKQGKNIVAVIKNMTKNGDHYWITTDFDIKYDRSGKVRHYIAFRQAAPRHVIKEIEPLYKRLRKIEDEYGMRASIEYLNDYLDIKGMNYDCFIEEIAKPRGLSVLFFSKMKQLFW
jgi:PAS domain S-box-containing protein